VGKSQRVSRVGGAGGVDGFEQPSTHVADLDLCTSKAKKVGERRWGRWGRCR